MKLGGGQKKKHPECDHIDLASLTLCIKNGCVCLLHFWVNFGKFLDATSRDPPPSLKVCKSSFTQNPGRGGPLYKSEKLVLHTIGGGPPPLKSVRNSH